MSNTVGERNIYLMSQPQLVMKITELEEYINKMEDVLDEQGMLDLVQELMESDNE